MSSDKCEICGNEQAEILEQHHIIPRRFGGGDESENVVPLCPNCHTAVERLYGKRFYDELGVEKEVASEDVDSACAHKGCACQETSRVQNGDIEIWVCQEHKRCERNWCGRRNVSIVPAEAGGIRLVCDRHRTCAAGECASQDVTLIDCGRGGAKMLCDDHAAERGAA